MKKTMVCLMTLAGLSLLAGILMKLHITSGHILGTVPSSWVQLAIVFLLGAIAAGVYGGDCCKKD